ncbi:tautomerase family protein [Pseudarthrobacter enclensis]|uniref:Phenylpyruvate tautomerase PptA (4-oxalocrotonate tautomerase family) n=1 Tax=Pseudarthrobacter enclensis TaxID=993070 RepID=A0ABT9RV50_9MICC|nr:tautomerase family protein [Pseudarthrobacter enclensis]MDP9888670.1 phenylpyruvate tautomerase PptA (4-oxalocrotonate tautomerase family) [Pseudarthrobacter enclensis]
MAIIEATFFDRRFDDEAFRGQMVEAITQAVTSVLGEAAGDDTTVILHGVAPSRWGYGGKLLG